MAKFNPEEYTSTEYLNYLKNLSDDELYKRYIEEADSRKSALNQKVFIGKITQTLSKTKNSEPIYPWAAAVYAWNDAAKDAIIRSFYWAQGSMAKNKKSINIDAVCEDINMILDAKDFTDCYNELSSGASPAKEIQKLENTLRTLAKDIILDRALSFTPRTDGDGV